MLCFFNITGLSPQERTMICRVMLRLMQLKVLVLAIASASLGSPAQAQSDDKLKLGHQTPPTFETVYRHFAVDGGFFAKQHVDASIVGFNAGLTTVQAVVSGSVDIGCESIVSVMAAVREGADLRILEMINADNSYVIVARGTTTAPLDLRGKRWGISQAGAISQTYSKLWLDHFGIGDNIDWIPIGGQSARARALLAGQIDVTMLTIGDWIAIQKQPDVKLMGNLADVVPPLPFSSCFATGQTVRSKFALTQRVINALMDAVRFAHTPDGKVAYLAAYRRSNDTKLTDGQLGQFYDYFFERNPILVDPNGGMYPDVLNKNLAMMVDDKTLNAMPPLGQVWEPRFVQQYLGNNGWYDAKTKTAGHYLRDLLVRP
jgi:ABC-type nitrate/sulfonate/bicarbonate transport system substrate-binding protein